MKLPKGLAGVVIAKTQITSTKNEQLSYCGYAIEELMDASFEEVVYLLWYGRLPTSEELIRFSHELVTKMVLPAESVRLLLYIAKEPQHPMSILRTATSLLGTTNDVKEDDPPKILSKMLTMIASIVRIREEQPLMEVDQKLNLVGNFLYMLTGNKPDDELNKMFTKVMILHADHEFNASTFTARVVASTFADYYSCLTSAVCVLKGSLHGGANEKVFEMLEEIRFSESNPIEYVTKKLTNNEKVMGFGHRVYKNGDPRAKILQKIAKKIAYNTENQAYYKIQQEIAVYMLQEKGLYPNVDYYTALIYHCLGLDKAVFTTIFAGCRSAGWLAHIIEQRRENCLIRPCSEYVGPENKHYSTDFSQ